jgi:predicted ATPase
MALLSGAFSRMKEGGGRVILVSGEVGISKTRLVNEFGWMLEEAG